MNNKFLSFLGLIMKSGNLTFGMDPVKDNLLKKNIALILTCKDISNPSRRKINYIAKQNNVNIKSINYTKDEIYSATGKYAAIIGVSGENFINKLNTLIENSITDPQNNETTGRNNLYVNKI